MENNQMALLYKILKSSNLIDDADKLKYDDVSSPQYRALQWITSQPFSHSDSSLQNDEMLLQSDVELAPAIFEYHNGIPANQFGSYQRIQTVLERYALGVLFLSFSPDSGSHLSNEENGPWLSNDHVCTWNGVVCHSYYRIVTQLNLSNSNLEGTMPPELVYLRSLHLLDLSNNSLSGEVHGTISRVPMLGTILLHKNSFTGNMPEELCDNVKHGSLKTLSINCHSDHNVFESKGVDCKCCTQCS